MTTPTIQFQGGLQSPADLVSIQARRALLLDPAMENALLSRRQHFTLLEGTSVIGGSISGTRRARRSMLSGYPPTDALLVGRRATPVARLSAAPSTLAPVAVLVGIHAAPKVSMTGKTVQPGTLTTKDGPLRHSVLWGGAAADALIIAKRQPRRSYLFAPDPVQRSGLLMPDYPMVGSDIGTPAYIGRVSDELELSDVRTAVWIQVLRAAVIIASDPTAIYDSHKAVIDRVVLADGLLAMVRMAIADGLDFSDEPSAWMGIALHLRDTVRLSAIPSASYDAHVAVVATFALRSLLRDAQRGILADGVDLAEALVARINAFNQLLDSLALEASLGHSAILHAILSDSTSFSDTATEYLDIRKALQDGAQFGLTLFTGEDTYTAWVMTTETRAMRRYLNYPFNSFAELDGRIYGAGPDGLFLLEGADDDGTQIKASVRTGLMDFGIRQLKRMERAYLGYASDGTLCLRVTNTSETGAKMECTYKMVQRAADAPREQRIQVGKGLQSVYWQFELTNEEGSNFELHDMTLLPMVLSRRVR